VKILLVEDEAKTGEYLKQGLTEAGYTTHWVKDGLAGHHHALSEEYDLVILDVMLPEISGWQVLAAIRRAGKSMPVLFLTARDQVEDRVKGLELGPTITWSNPLPSPNFWRVFVLCSGGAAVVSLSCCRWRIWSWMSCAGVRCGRDAALILRPRNSPCWSC